MRDLLAFKNLFLVIALFSLAMFGLWGISEKGINEYFIPKPEMVVEQFLIALKAHRYEAARDMLVQDLRDKVSEVDLERLSHSIGNIEDAHGQGSRPDRNILMAVALVKLSDGREQIVEFPFKKENGLWKIVSI
jgi:hypothetical protein